jgi:hypothetical protein
MSFVLGVIRDQVDAFPTASTSPPTLRLPLRRPPSARLCILPRLSRPAAAARLPAPAARALPHQHHDLADRVRTAAEPCLPIRPSRFSRALLPKSTPSPRASPPSTCASRPVPRSLRPSSPPAPMPSKPALPPPRTTPRRPSAHSLPAMSLQGPRRAGLGSRLTANIRRQPQRQFKPPPRSRL